MACDTSGVELPQKYATMHIIFIRPKAPIM